MKEKHIRRLLKLQNKLDSEIQKTGRPTPEVLNLQAMSAKALKLKQFDKITQIKKRIRELGYSA